MPIEELFLSSIKHERTVLASVLPADGWYFEINILSTNIEPLISTGSHVRRGQIEFNEIQPNLQRITDKKYTEDNHST